MPMTWTPEANAKACISLPLHPYSSNALTPTHNTILFLAVLEQIKEQGVKINNAKLAEYMGPECSVRAVDHQLQKLKKQAEPSDSVAGSAAGAGDGSASASATPTKTGTKRRAVGSKTGTPRKRGKKQVDDEAANGDGVSAGTGVENGDGQGGGQAADGDAAGQAEEGDEKV
ncbi:hypothetical protein BDW69DRAFT_190479 [Aspergillus filifer]